jgi:precorrin-2/cobalt-factor-2 C20-methyltransferase
MIALETLAGTASPATLYGIGVGPGDARYMTLRAAGLVMSVTVIAYFAKRGVKGNARTIADPLIGPGREEIRLEYPVTEDIPAGDPAYAAQISAFYAAAADRLAGVLREGHSVGLLAEGDPFFYGSCMHMWRRLAADFPVEIVPGVTGMSGCWARAGAPITWGDDTLSVLTGTLPEAELARRLAQTDAAVIMKVGRHLPKVRRAVQAAGLMARAVYVERGTMPDERILPLAECTAERGPYFSIVLIPGQGRAL